MRKDHRNGYVFSGKQKFKTIINMPRSSLCGISEFACQRKRTEKFQVGGIGAFEL